MNPKFLLVLFLLIILTESTSATWWRKRCPRPAPPGKVYICKPVDHKFELKLIDENELHGQLRPNTLLNNDTFLDCNCKKRPPSTQVFPHVQCVNRTICPPCNDKCDCIKPSIFTVRYEGPSDVTIEIYKNPNDVGDAGKLLHTFFDVDNGDSLVLSSLFFGKNKLESNTAYNVIQNGQSIAVVSIHTSCSQDLFIGQMHNDGDVTLIVEGGTDLNGQNTLPREKCFNHDHHDEHHDWEDWENGGDDDDWKRKKHHKDKCPPCDENVCWAIFGYNSTLDDSVLIEIGSDNRFIPSPQNRGQPTVFHPGINSNVVNVTFECDDPDFLRWRIDDNDSKRINEWFDKKFPKCIPDICGVFGGDNSTCEPPNGNGEPPNGDDDDCIPKVNITVHGDGINCTLRELEDGGDYEFECHTELRNPRSRVIIGFDPYKQCSIYDRGTCDSFDGDLQTPLCDVFDPDDDDNHWNSTVMNDTIVWIKRDFTLAELLGCRAFGDNASELVNHSIINDQLVIDGILFITVVTHDDCENETKCENIDASASFAFKIIVNQTGHSHAHFMPETIDLEADPRKVFFAPSGDIRIVFDTLVNHVEQDPPTELITTELCNPVVVSGVPTMVVISGTTCLNDNFDFETKCHQKWVIGTTGGNTGPFDGLQLVEFDVCVRNVTRTQARVCINVDVDGQGQGPEIEDVHTEFDAMLDLFRDDQFMIPYDPDMQGENKSFIDCEDICGLIMLDVPRSKKDDYKIIVEEIRMCSSPDEDLEPFDEFDPENTGCEAQGKNIVIHTLFNETGNFTNDFFKFRFVTNPPNTCAEVGFCFQHKIFSLNRVLVEVWWRMEVKSHSHRFGEEPLRHSHQLLLSVKDIVMGKTQPKDLVINWADDDHHDDWEWKSWDDCDQDECDRHDDWQPMKRKHCTTFKPKCAKDWIFVKDDPFKCHHRMVVWEDKHGNKSVHHGDIWIWILVFFILVGLVTLCWCGCGFSDYHDHGYGGYAPSDNIYKRSTHYQDRGQHYDERVLRGTTGYPRRRRGMWGFGY